MQEKLEKGWTNSLAAGLERAEREGKPVLDRLLGDLVQELSDDGQDDAWRMRPVIAALENYVKVKFQAEDPDAEPAKSVMARFNAVGLPTYVIPSEGSATN